MATSQRFVTTFTDFEYGEMLGWVIGTIPDRGMVAAIKTALHEHQAARDAVPMQADREREARRQELRDAVVNAARHWRDNAESFDGIDPFLVEAVDALVAFEAAQ